MYTSWSDKKHLFDYRGNDDPLISNTLWRIAAGTKYQRTPESFWEQASYLSNQSYSWIWERLQLRDLSDWS